MQKALLYSGGRGLLVALVLFLVGFLAGKTFDLSYSVQEFIGYLSIVLALLFVFFGIRRYRDLENGGRLSYRDGLLLGMGITLFVALGAAVADLIYVTVLYPDFVTDYTAYQIEKFRVSLPPEAFEAKKLALLDQVASIGHPSVMALIMFATVVVMGFMVTLLSTVLLRRA